MFVRNCCRPHLQRKLDEAQVYRQPKRVDYSITVAVFNWGKTGNPRGCNADQTIKNTTAGEEWQWSAGPFIIAFWFAILGHTTAMIQMIPSGVLSVIAAIASHTGVYTEACPLACKHVTTVSSSHVTSRSILGISKDSHPHVSKQAISSSTAYSCVIDRQHVIPAHRSDQITALILEWRWFISFSFIFK
jgi:hypothetical protein